MEPHAIDHLEQVAEVVRAHGAYARPVREVVSALTERAWVFDELISRFAMPRRTLEELLAAVGTDLVDGEVLTIRSDRVDAYRVGLDLDSLAATAPDDPLGGQVARHADLMARMAALRAAAPAPRHALDHVAATPETALRRGLWLAAGYDLAGAELLCVGDHDLTALAACLVEPRLSATVVDLDERILEYIDGVAGAAGVRVRCLFGDVRFGLPPGAVGTADIAFTDPPYTPEGVRLFLARAAEGLRERERGRLLLAYGFSDRTPALGLKVQQAIVELHLATEAVHPRFNRYLGAQAVGGSSDLYVLRPTARTWRALPAVSASAATIYTKGTQATEATASTMDDTTAVAVLALAAGPDRLDVLAIGDGWPIPPGKGGRPLGTVFSSGVPAQSRAGGVAVDCSTDPGEWLFRVLLGVNAARLAVLVPNGHPALADATGQRALAELFGPKWRITFRRGTPDAAHAVVEAAAVDEAGLTGGRALVRRVLDRAHGKLGNVWRDSLVAVSGLTRDDAAAVVAKAGPEPILPATPMELPRHQLTALLAVVGASA